MEGLGRTVTVLGHDDVGLTGTVFLVIEVRACTRNTTSASCSIEPDSRRSESCGFLSLRISGPRFSWDKATTGTSSSLAKSFRARENSETSCWRDSTALPEVMSCR